MKEMLEVEGKGGRIELGGNRYILTADIRQWILHIISQGKYQYFTDTEFLCNRLLWDKGIVLSKEVKGELEDVQDVHRGVVKSIITITTLMHEGLLKLYDLLYEKKKMLKKKLNIEILKIDDKAKIHLESVSPVSFNLILVYSNREYYFGNSTDLFLSLLRKRIFDNFNSNKITVLEGLIKFIADYRIEVEIERYREGLEVQLSRPEGVMFIETTQKQYEITGEPEEQTRERVVLEKVGV